MPVPAPGGIETGTDHATVNRTTNGTGRISDMTLATFRALRTPDGQRPATPTEALEVVRDGGGQVLVDLEEVPGAGTAGRWLIAAAGAGDSSRRGGSLR